eukprot:3752280-Amphidinium_carterae.1
MSRDLACRNCKRERKEYKSTEHDPRLNDVFDCDDPCFAFDSICPLLPGTKVKALVPQADLLVFDVKRH